MAISTYLNRLSNLRDELEDILVNKGVEVTENAPLSTLVPLVSDIQLGTESSPFEKPLYSFGVLSDVHVIADEWKNKIGTSNPNSLSTEHFIAALQFYQNSDVDFVCVDGDVVWSGAGGDWTSTNLLQEEAAKEWVSELQLYRSLCDTYFTKSVYTCTGNHDANMYGYSHGDHGLNLTVPATVYGDGTLRAYEVWEDVIGTHHNFVVQKNEDVFIFFGMSFWNYVNFCSSEEETWLYTKLEENKDKRVFLFFHVPMNDTFDVSHNIGLDGTLTTGAVSRVRKWLLAYKNVIWFSGHNHYGMQLEGNAQYNNSHIYQQDSSMTMINVPSCAFIREITGGTYEKPTIQRRYEESQGLLVDVFANRIVIKSIDFVSKQLINKATYVANKQ